MKPHEYAFSLAVSLCVGVACAALAILVEVIVEHEGLASEMLATLWCVGAAVGTFLHLRKILRRAA